MSRATIAGRSRGAGDWALAVLVRAFFALMRLLGPTVAPALGGAVARVVGPLTPTQRIVAANLRLAFPGQDAAWHRATARAAWDNLGRTACEYVHLAHLFTHRIDADPDSLARFAAMGAGGGPVLVFGAHLANWELPAVSAHAHGQHAAILYRTPNNHRIAADITAMREPIMGRLIPTGMMAPIRMAEALDGGLNLGMLIDQRFGRGPRVPFFGQPVAANPFLARLARRFDVPVYGMRAVRTPGGRFRVLLEGPFDLPRDTTGKVAIEPATALLNHIIEGWVREYPGQWLWMHRRWR